MSKRNVYEILDDFRLATTKDERIDVLQRNDCFPLRQVLYATFNPNITFDIPRVPNFIRGEEIPQGMSYSTMTEALHKAYLFQKANPKRPKGLTDKRQEELLVQLLESLEEPEADVYIGMLTKDLNVPYLTAKLVNEAYPNLRIPEKGNEKVQRVSTKQQRQKKDKQKAPITPLETDTTYTQGE
jgi:hypothetical protein